MTSIYEWTGLIAGVGSTILLVRNNVLAWPVGIVAIVSYGVMMYRAEMYGNMVIQCLMLGQSLYGWYQWAQHDKKGDLPITRYIVEFTLLHILVMLAVSSAFIGFSMFLGSKMPVLDGLVSSFSLLGLLLSARRKIEAWYFWIAFDTLSIYNFYREELYVGAFSYVLFLVLATIGYFQWKKKLVYT